MARTYAQKLRDPRWQKRRLEVFERDRFECQSCYSSDKELQVHHLKYIQDADPWDYELSDLKTLCDECHGMISKCGRIVAENVRKMDSEYARGMAVLSKLFADNYDISIVVAIAKMLADDEDAFRHGHHVKALKRVVELCQDIDREVRAAAKEIAT